MCFQRDGCVAVYPRPLISSYKTDGTPWRRTRHLTLLTLNGVTAAEAQRVTLDVSVLLPLRLTFSGLSQKSSVLLLADADCKRRLAPLLSRGSYGSLPSSGSVQTQNFVHLSLFRVRSKPQGYLQEFWKVRAACAGISWGAVDGTSVVIKEVGSDYTECRVLASS